MTEIRAIRVIQKGSVSCENNQYIKDVVSLGLEGSEYTAISTPMAPRLINTIKTPKNMDIPIRTIMDSICKGRFIGNQLS